MAFWIDNVARIIKEVRMSARSNQSTGWVGWIMFASFMMMLVGIFQVIAGLVAIFKDEYY
jgi:hypothetical protein